MKKYIFYLSTFIITSSLFAQNGKVGFGTSVPQQTLHIDAASNTPANSTTTNISDDVVVTSQGYLGIGTTVPNKRLEINATAPNGAIKIVDTTEKQNAFLKSDADGIGSWYVQGSIKPIQLGVWSQYNQIIFSDNTGGIKDLQIYIDLTPGIWMINFGATFKASDSVSKPFWMHLYLSDKTTSRSNTTFSYMGSAGNNTAYAGLIMQNRTVAVGNANFMTGSTIIKVNQDTRIWVLAENINRSIPDVANWTFKADNWENYFYAMPLDGQ